MWPSILLIIITFLLAVSVDYILYIRKRSLMGYDKNLSGPCGIPFIGSALSFFSGNLHEICRLWADKYGGVFAFRVFRQEYIVVSSYEAIREVLILRGKSFGGRMPWKERKGQKKPFRDILNGNISPYWKMMRNSVHGNLKLYGNGLAKFENSLSIVSDDLLNDIKEKRDQSFDIYPMLYMTMATFIMTLISGQEIDRNDIMLTKLKLGIEEQTRQVGGAMVSSQIAMVAPWLGKLFNKSDKIKGYLRRSVEEMWHDFLLPLKKTPQFAAGSGLFAEMCNLQNKLEGDEELQFCDGDMRVVISNILLAGTLTTSSTIYGFLNVILHKSDVQERIASEVHSKVGIEGRISLADRQDMPYTSACILEILRLSNVAPVGIPHMTTEDTEVDGFHIKKGTGVIVNYWHLLHSDQFWENPWEFQPERFLDENGRICAADHPNRQRLIAFGAGPRVCLGEVLARNRLFLVISTLIQKFKFSSPDGVEKIPYDPRLYPYASIMKPPAFDVIASEREGN